MALAKAKLHRRVHNLEQAYAEFGDRIERLSTWLAVCDPAADQWIEAQPHFPHHRGAFEQALEHGIESVKDAPEPLQHLFAEAERIPTWVNWDRIERGGRALLRTGFFGGITLAVKSLVYGYCAPAGNKPLVMSGQLQSRAARRLNETSRFVQAVIVPGGMRRNGDGFKISLRVRMIHAQVRRLIRESGRWQPELWAEPINQHDMLATNLLFSVVLLDGLRQFGFRLSSSESEDYIHLWRYIGYVIGVEPELLPATEAEGMEYARLILLTQGSPDNDSRDLVDAMLMAPLRDPPKDPKERAAMEKRVRLAQGLCRSMLGSELADALAIPSTPWEHAIVPLRTVVSMFEKVYYATPGLEAWAVRKGQSYWEMIIAQGLEGKPALFEPPEDLLGVFAS